MNKQAVCKVSKQADKQAVFETTYSKKNQPSKQILVQTKKLTNKTFPLCRTNIIYCSVLLPL